MKAILALFVLIAIPVMLLVMMIAIILPSLAQRFFTPKAAEDKKIYPYLTSWEEAA